MTAPTLRPYQQSDITRIRTSYANGARRVLYQAPTGSGKTVLFSEIVRGAAARGNRVVILGHRDEIVQQIGEALTALDVAHGIIAAGYPETPELPVQIASVPTLVRRLDRLHRVDLLVIDESHHATAGTWSKIIAALPEAKLIGVTATPERLDGKGLGEIFDMLIIGPSAAGLIAQGYLSPYTTFAPAKAPDLSNIRRARATMPPTSWPQSCPAPS
jgi:DNA repair protein RadD